jgi:hypothetical protein
MRYLIIAVVFLGLLSVFSAYAVVYTQGVPTQKQSTATLASISMAGTYDYVASLRPNTVYNTTTLRMGQGALFVAITKSINVTFTCALTMSAQSNVNLSSSYEVILSGGAWNKTLGRSSGSVDQAGVYTTVTSKSFELNLTQIEGLQKEIDGQLQYTAQSYQVQIRPVLTGQVSAAGKSVPLGLSAPLNMTFSAGVIEVNGTSYIQHGTVTGETEVTDNGAVQNRYVSYGLLAGSLILLAVGAFYLTRGGKAVAADQVHELEMKVRPYREVIAASRSPPEGERRIAMSTWEDLVKVSDTLGKPIIEFIEGNADAPKLHSFWVLDGEVMYIFEPMLPKG